LHSPDVQSPAKPVEAGRAVNDALGHTLDESLQLGEGPISPVVVGAERLRVFWLCFRFESGIPPIFLWYFL